MQGFLKRFVLNLRPFKRLELYICGRLDTTITDVIDCSPLHTLEKEQFVSMKPARYRLQSNKLNIIYRYNKDNILSTERSMSVLKKSSLVTRFKDESIESVNKWPIDTET